MALYKDYLSTKEENVFIKITLIFNKESYNWSTNEPRKIGYMVNAKPVQVRESYGCRIEEFMPFTGFNDVIYPVGRQSEKRKREAIHMINMKMDQYKAFFQAKGIEITE